MFRFPKRLKKRIRISFSSRSDNRSQILADAAAGTGIAARAPKLAGVDAETP